MRPSGTEEVNFNLYFTLVNLDIISHVWLMGTRTEQQHLSHSGPEPRPGCPGCPGPAGCLAWLLFTASSIDPVELLALSIPVPISQTWLIISKLTKVKYKLKFTSSVPLGLI